MGGPTSPESSQKSVRRWCGIIVVLILICVIEQSGIFDFPGNWDDSNPSNLFCGFMVGIFVGISWAHGWPNDVSTTLSLSPSLQHEEEEED